MSGGAAMARLLDAIILLVLGEIVAALWPARSRRAASHPVVPPLAWHLGAGLCLLAALRVAHAARRDAPSAPATLACLAASLGLHLAARASNARSARATGARRTGAR